MTIKIQSLNKYKSKIKDMGIFGKVKILLVIVIVVVIIWFVVKAKKMRPEFENMLKKEFKLASKIFAVRDLVDENKSSRYENESEKYYRKSYNKYKRGKVKTANEDIDETLRIRKKKTGGRRGSSRRSGSKTSNYMREEICRAVFEDYFDDYFPSVRPKFLKNPKTGRPLELDGYNASLNLAFEHNGKQHYVYPNAFHKSEADYRSQIERDEYKMKRCFELGIDVLTIPYTIPTDEIKSYIHDYLKSKRYKQVSK